MEPPLCFIVNFTHNGNFFHRQNDELETRKLIVLNQIRISNKPACFHSNKWQYVLLFFSFNFSYLRVCTIHRHSVFVQSSFKIQLFRFASRARFIYKNIYLTSFSAKVNFVLTNLTRLLYQVVQ